MTMEEESVGSHIIITIDGDMSDWSEIKPLYVDELGDTQPWSTDTDILSTGNTPEAPEQVLINDRARDLKAIYIFIDTDAIYVKLDVNSLTGDWGYPGMNASCYVIAFDTDLVRESGVDDLSKVCDTFTDKRAYWERILCLENSASAFVQDNNWAIIDSTWEGNLQLAQNVTAGAFEIKIPLEDFPSEWIGRPLAVTVVSFKPGEYPESGTNQWLHAFDPQAPGTPGETWGDPGTSAVGSDIADVIPGGIKGINSSLRVKDFLTVFEPVPDDTNIIKVDCRESLGNIRSLQGVNNGPIPWNEYYDFSEDYKEMGVDWVRLHDLHGSLGNGDDNWVGAVDIHYIFHRFKADPNNPENYDFKRTDLHIQSIKDTGADIIYRLGYSWGTINQPPADISQWVSICLHIIRHYNEGWADGFHYNITYWEIWNEPDINIFWTGTPREYYDLYKATANAIKSYDPDLKVGGPCLAYKLDFLDGFLDYCSTFNVPLDFVSWHFYSNNPYEAYLRSEAVENIMETYGYSSLESVLTEWNIWVPATASGWDRWYGLRYSPGLAAFTASALIYLQDTSTDIANYYRGDSWNWGGLFDSSGESGKAFYAFKAFKMLLDTQDRVYCSGSDKDGYGTIAGISDDSRSVTILVSDYRSGFNKYYLIVQNLPWGNVPFVYERYIINETCNLELVDSKQLQGESFSITNDMASPSVHLIRLSVIKPVD
jgi:xylan 1,4-beta-xylosidase